MDRNGVPLTKEELAEFRASIDRAMEQTRRDQAAQEERERNDPPDRVRIEFDDIAWRMHTKEVWVKGEKDPFIELSWGWTAGMTEEQINKTADDSPRGHCQVLIAKEFVVELAEQLNKWLASQKE